MPTTETKEKISSETVTAAVVIYLTGKKDVLSKNIVAESGYTAGRVHLALKGLIESGKAIRRQLTKEQVEGYRAGALPYVYTLKK